MEQDINNLDITEEENVERVKKWISEYWITILLAVMLAVGSLWGFDYYKKSKLEKVNLQAVKLDSLRTFITENKLDDAEKKILEIQADKESSFATIAGLELAKAYFINKNYEKSLKQYEWLAANAPDIAIKDIANLRKARVLIAQKQYDKAITTLKGLLTKDFNLEANLLKGDVLLAQGKNEEAIKAYESTSKDKNYTPIVLQRIQLAGIKKSKK